MWLPWEMIQAQVCMHHSSKGRMATSLASLHARYSGTGVFVSLRATAGFAVLPAPQPLSSACFYLCCWAWTQEGGVLVAGRCV